MKAILIVCLCIAAVNCAGRRERPDFDCPRFCGGKTYKPICSTEGKTFDNDCFLECNWHYKECDGGCPCYRPRPVAPPVAPPVQQIRYCSCERKYDPVCTNEGTEQNECVAKCQGKIVYYDFPCMD